MHSGIVSVVGGSKNNCSPNIMSMHPRYLQCVWTESWNLSEGKEEHLLNMCDWFGCYI